ncbi:MAG: hypothetical protein Q4D48_02290 [Coriobacteriales bacterium]|nr:hypothetical protein [Coriobacteriales bacterium]
MRILKQIRNSVIGVVVLSSLGVAAYYLLLTDEARKSLHEAFDSVVDSYHTISDTIQDLTGIVMDEDKEYLPNRESIIEQWKSMGF